MRIIKKHKYIAGIIGFAVLYVCLYAIRCRQEEPLKINYYDMDATIENGGIEYHIEDVDFCSENELLEKYDIDKNDLGKLDSDETFIYIVVTKKVTKLQEDYNDYINKDFYYTHIYSKHMLIGMSNFATVELNKNLGKKTLDELGVGESETLYQIYDMAAGNHEKELWDNYDKQTYYFEITDNEYHRYVDRIRIYN